MTYPFVRSAVDLGRARGPRLAFVVHMAEGGGTVGYLSRPNPNGVSVHFVIERSGRTVQMLELSHMHSSIRANAVRTSDDPDRFFGATAAKAVMGDWARPGRTLGPNHASIALEIEGFARDGPNTAQKAALKALYADLRKRYPGIRSLGHRDFVSYKACPGKRIPWDQIGGHGKTQPATPAKEEPVTTGNRLTDAIVTRAGYLANELKAGDEAGALTQGVKIIEFAARAMGTTAPVAVAASSLSPQGQAIVASSPQWALLNEIGFSPDTYVTTQPDGSQVVAAIDPTSIMAAADEQQERELALLGVFGSPGTYPDIDYSLFEEYYQRVGGSNNWEPKEPYALTGTWQAYQASKA